MTCPSGNAPPTKLKKTFVWRLHLKSSFSATFCTLFPYPARLESRASAKNGQNCTRKTRPQGVNEEWMEQHRRASFEPPPAYNDGVGPGGLPAGGLDVSDRRRCVLAGGTRPFCSCEPSSAYTTAAPLCTNLTASVWTRVPRRGCKVCGFVRPCSQLLSLEAGCSRKQARPLVVTLLGSTTPLLEKEPRAAGCRQDMWVTRAYLLPAWRSRYADMRGYPLA